MTVHAQSSALSREDPAKIVSAETCGECHLSTYAVWKGTPHARGFKTLHRKASAEAIAGKLGLRLVKRDSVCLRCHYTPTVDDGELKAAAGVTCESCHGAGQDWIDVHNDYGGGGADHNSESAEHRQTRVEQSRAAGMRRPSDDLYAVASTCFGCHAVPEEELVNVGGHGTGSAGFELVAWSQGEIRHNFLDSFLNGDGSVNAVRPPPELRTLYVLGRSLDLEHSLRGMAEATATGLYGKAMSRRVRAAVGEVREINRAQVLSEINAMLETVRAVEVVPNNRDALLAAADAVGAAARQFLASHDGTQLAAIDPLRLGEGITDDDPEPVDDPATTSETVVAAAADDGATPVGTSSADGGRGEAVSEASAAPRNSGGTPAVPAVGAFKRKVRATSNFDTIGPGACSGCHRHQQQAIWWYEDPHYGAADRFFEGAPDAVQIARLYGIKTADMAKGNQVCMDCHGSVVSGKEKREVQDGVGCESCHGPAKQYLDPHQEGEPSLGVARPGYQRALELGMRALREPAVTAKTCTECHFITEPRLISAGHPSGRGFDYAGGMQQIKHWDEPRPDGALAAAFGTALAARGSVPDVVRARLATAGSGGSGTAGDPSSEAVPGATAGAGSADLGRAGARHPRRPAPPRPRPVDPRSVPASGGVELALPQFPEFGADATIEARLRALQQRLKALYTAVATAEDRR